MTDWKSVSDDLQVAAGLRLFLADENDRPILEARTIEFDGTAAETPVS
jgi:protein involved in temperature-dependent protein secretion